MLLKVNINFLCFCLKLFIVDEPRSGLSPRNPNVENKRKISREEHVQNLKFFPYQNDCLFPDEQARSPIARRPSKI